MTTRLAGEKTHFLPFNLGTTTAAPATRSTRTASATAYLWERSCSATPG